jgi:D-glycero-alpha-D-manno-heptose-7-phosphate kinase
MEGIHVEQELLKETVGSQDQVLAAYGGLNHVSFLPTGEIIVQPVIMPAERLADFGAHQMLFYTGIKRTASDVAASYVPGIEDRRRQLRIMQHLVEESLTLLASNRDITAFGELLHEAWQAKRSLSDSVSNAEVDGVYARGREAGALGGKLLGAGGGGFLLLFVPPAKQADVKAALANLICVPVQMEASGSQIIFFDAERDYASEELARSNHTIDAFRELGGTEGA